MKNAILLQGAGEIQESFWLPYLKKELEKRGYGVWLPQLPENDDPDIKKNLPFVLRGGEFTKDTIIIGHSCGAPLTLAVLQNLKTQIKRAILVAGFHRKLLPPGVDKILLEKYDWEKIKKNVEEIIFINSDNDPWGCNDKQGREMFDKLGGVLIVKHNEGHMGSDTFKQPYKKFPLLVVLTEGGLWGSK